jgi:hypothetical protein
MIDQVKLKLDEYEVSMEDKKGKDTQGKQEELDGTSESNTCSWPESFSGRASILTSEAERMDEDVSDNPVKDAGMQGESSVMETHVVVDGEAREGDQGGNTAESETGKREVHQVIKIWCHTCHGCQTVEAKDIEAIIEGNRLAEEVTGRLYNDPEAKG